MLFQDNKIVKERVYEIYYDKIKSQIIRGANNMKKRKLSTIDKVFSYILLGLAIFSCLLGILLVTSVIKLVDSFPISSICFGCFLIII